jgi:hypothetical protein
MIWRRVKTILWAGFSASFASGSSAIWRLKDARSDVFRAKHSIVIYSSRKKIILYPLKIFGKNRAALWHTTLYNSQLEKIQLDNFPLTTVIPQRKGNVANKIPGLDKTSTIPSRLVIETKIQDDQSYSEIRKQYVMWNTFQLICRATILTAFSLKKGRFRDPFRLCHKRRLWHA